MSVLARLRRAFEPVLRELSPDPAKVPDFLAMIKPAQDPRKGDYQANFAMPLAKLLGRKPPELAATVVARLPLGDWLEKPEVAGPGFINIRLRADWLARTVREMAADARLGIPKPEKPLTVVIDYSSPNVAKPLHVGHLRSTIIGDALARLFRFLGHTVIADNHLGDWGTQFGMLLYGYKHFLNRDAYEKNRVRELARLYLKVRDLDTTFQVLTLSYQQFCDRSAFASDPIGELARVYPAAERRVKSKDEDEDAGVTNPVKDAYRTETAKLHAGDPENVALWKEFMPACLEEIHAIYRRLDVHFDYELGESFYQPMLAGVVEDLLKKGVAVESQGAVVIPNARGIIPTREQIEKGEDPPALVRKRDGAFTYTTSDLATIRYRVETWHPDKILYVVDFRQSLHFRTLFAEARHWGYDDVELTHVSFGSVLGQDRKPIKTREGGGVELNQLLDEAVRLGLEKYIQTRAERLARGEEVPELSEQERREIAEAVGIGAVKYADLSQHRTSDYVFNYDKMLATDGNTATYMQYAYARCRSIFRKGDEDPEPYRTDPPLPVLGTPHERGLALQLIRFGDVLDAAAGEYLPHLLTGYLWDLAKAYSGFFENCPVLTAETPELRRGRLLLCDLTGRVIRQTLELLGIRVLERM